MTSCRRGPQGGIITGLIIVTVGVVLLLAQIGFLNMHAVWRFWPLAFVLVGIGKIFDATAVSQRIWGSMLAIIGFLLLAHYFGHFRYGIDQLWPLFVIAGGLAMLFQVYFPGVRATNLPPGGSLNGLYVFGGTERNVADRNFTGGRLFACFGGYDIDLRQAEIAGDTAVLEATAIFGGGEIKVPPHWNVVSEGVGIFGGYQDSTRHAAPAGVAPKTFVVRGAAVFGGVEIKN
ncbi:MAG TPA: DUF5668 domain-containing protein [Candidatus Koribacter sp.]|jgi:hypothetical protein